MLITIPDRVSSFYLPFSQPGDTMSDLGVGNGGNANMNTNNMNQPGAGAGGSGLPQPGGGLSVDSISLGQLRSMVSNNQRPKQSWFDFKYDDEDTVMNEIEEFYSYVEMPQSAENLKAWEGCFSAGALQLYVRLWNA